MVHGPARCVVKIFRAGRYRRRDARALAFHLSKECRELVKIGLAPFFVWMMMTPRTLKAHTKEHLTEQRRKSGRFTARAVNHGGTNTMRAALGRQDLANHPVSNAVMKATPLGSGQLETPTGADPRSTLADWMLTPENPYFAKAMANRVWGQFFGRGIVQPVDDFRASNPPSNPEMLEALADDFAAHKFDLKHLMRRIMQSRLYQLSSVPNETNVQDTQNFSRFYRRRMGAENLEDIVNQVTGVTSEYSNLRLDARKVELWTTIMSSPMLESFGLPNSSENCPCERDNRPSMVQALHLMNSDKLQTQLADKQGRAAELGQADKSASEIVDEVYLLIYSRWPSAGERAIAVEAIETAEAKRQQAVEDLMWALINSAEFVFNH